MPSVNINLLTYDVHGNYKVKCCTDRCATTSNGHFSIIDAQVTEKIRSDELNPQLENSESCERLAIAPRKTILSLARRDSPTRAIIFERTTTTMTRTRACTRPREILPELENILLRGRERGSDYRAVSWHGFNFPAKYTRHAYIWRIGWVVSIASFITPR